MKIIEYAYGDSPKVGKCALALGYFDGLHLGHQKLMSCAGKIALEKGLEFGIFTFKTGTSVKPGAQKILSDTQKAELAKKLGADFIVFADFPSISSLSAEEFAKAVLVDSFKAQIAVAGFNYRFGKGALGDAKLLSSTMNKLGSEAIICDDYRLDGNTVSTTRIRDALRLGNINEANRLLGYTYFISGEVEHGRSVGSELGFPTLNVALDSSLIVPRAGVYRTLTEVDGVAYCSLTNLGTCPTFAEREAHLETYVLDFSGDLYGKTVRIYFLDFIRDEKRFLGKNELIMQINVDINSVIKDFGDKKWQEFGQNLQ